jgi:hypothetical protein
LVWVYNIAIATIGINTIIRTHVLDHTLLRQIIKNFRRFAPPPDIPIAEPRGFSAGFGNKKGNFCRSKQLRLLLLS